MRAVALLVASPVLACTAPNPEYLPPAAVTACTLGERSCVGRRPVECDSAGPDAGTVLKNAICPSAATCDAGLCDPPAGAHSCHRDADCPSGETCTGFVSAGAVATFCAQADGATPGAERCTASPQCRSSLCAPPAAGASAICFLACQSNVDCPTLNVCKSFDVTITGVRGRLHGCAPK
jgi:hypothetical protein